MTDITSLSFSWGKISNLATLTCTIVFMRLILVLVSFLLGSTETWSYDIFSNLHFSLLEVFIKADNVLPALLSWFYQPMIR